MTSAPWPAYRSGFAACHSLLIRVTQTSMGFHFMPSLERAIGLGFADGMAGAGSSSGRSAVITEFKRIVGHIVMSEAARDYTIGAGLAIDPLPQYHCRPFFQSDDKALFSDWLAVRGDLLEAIHLVTGNFLETSALEDAAHAEREQFDLFASGD